jgi:hypothetical protein
MKQAPCEDCGKDTKPKNKRGKALFKQWDCYIVRDEVWAEAGMAGWKGGFLCTPCLSKRLVRKPTMGRDYLARKVGVNSDGDLEMEAHRDYLKHHSVVNVSRHVSITSTNMS